MEFPYEKTSFNFDKTMTVEDFKTYQANNPFLGFFLPKNPNLFTDLYNFLISKDKHIKTTYEIFGKTLNLYKVEGLPLFYLRETSRGGIVLYIANKKMEYLEEIKLRKLDLDLYYSHSLFGDAFKKLQEHKEFFDKEFSNFFAFNLDIQKNSNYYSRVLMYAVENLLHSAEQYFKDLTPEEILGLNENKYNLVKSDISESFKNFHRLIKYISINHTPYEHLKSVEFISNLVDRANNAYFEYTYLYEVLESESKKIANEDVYKNIENKGKLLELHLKSTEKKERIANSIPYDSKIFLSKEAQDWFFDTLEEINAVSGKETLRGFQAKCNAIFLNKECKNNIFKYQLSLTKYISFLNSFYGDVIKANDKLSDGGLYEDKVSDLISIYLNR